ncbi:hypothetical protein Tco_0558927 [Tanacetum coccineum]
MADNRTMAQMLQAPIEGYEDAIVVPPINANNFELKQPLINLVQSNKFTGRQDPHNHLRFFNKVTSTFRHPEVPNTSIKLLLFPLEGGFQHNSRSSPVNCKRVDYVDASVRSYMSGHILHVHPAQVQSSSVPEQQHQLYLAMKADPLLQQQDIAIWLALQMKFEKTQVPHTACRPSAIRPRDQDDPHDDAHPEGENSAKRQKTSEYEAYVSGESSSGQVNIEEPGPSTSDEEFLAKNIGLGKQNGKFLVSPQPQKIQTIGSKRQRDPEAPTLSLINQDLMLFKERNSVLEKIVPVTS